MKHVISATCLANGNPSNWKNQLLVIDEPFEFQKELVEVYQDFEKISNLFSDILWNIPKIDKGKVEDVNM
jgi:hypothetical protein